MDRKFSKFEKLDRKVERTLFEVEHMDKRKFYKNSFVYAAIWAVALNLIIETLGRLSTGDVFSGIRFLFSEPVIFFYNVLIIYATLVTASLFRRRTFVFTLVAILWLALGIGNGVILMNRMTPFTVKDFSNVREGLAVATNYLSVWGLVLIGIAALACIGLIVLLYIKGPKKNVVKRKRNLVAVLLIFATTFSATTLVMKAGIVDTFFGNLAYAYRDNGVVYCFANTWLNTGISKPSGYSSQSIQKIFNKKELGEDNVMLLENTDQDEEHPNILFLQLESFIDPLTINTIEVSQDPCPNYRRLIEQYSSGELTVPACGAGTANVEFEVLSGISAKFFGPGEYPYKAVLTEKTMETLAYDLKSMGYSAHAIHNHKAGFYNRNTVFSNMGFDTFTSLEYMRDVEKTPKDWAKDDVLTECIQDALDSTKGRDFIYTISVQPHGQYPEEEVFEEPVITVTSAPSEELKWKYEYYVNQIYEVDQVIGELIAQLEKSDEPIVLVMYGDHIPATDIEEDDLENNNIFGTQYVIWDNLGLEKKDEDLHTYQLAAHTLAKVDMQVGTVFTYQQNHRNSETYLQDLKALGYDMLYGKNYIYGGKNPFEATELKMGVKDIVIKEVVEIGNKYYIKGENFNSFSRITLEGKLLDTIYLGENVLGLLEEVDPQEAANMKVSQIEDKSKEILSTTE